MDNRSFGMISGNIYDGPEYSTSNRFQLNRVPAIGTSVEFDDGRKFVLCSTEVDVLAGQVVATPTCHESILANKCTAADVGATAITIDTTALAMFGGSAGVIAANRLAGGYLTIGDDAGEGHCYRIKSNTAGTASASIVVTLYDGLKVALTTASDIFITAPRYTKVVVGTATLPPVGVAVIASTAATNAREEYIWVQVRGIAQVYITTGTSVAIGKTVAADATGGLKIAGAVTDVMLGVAMATSTTATQKIPVLLNIGG